MTVDSNVIYTNRSFESEVMESPEFCMSLLFATLPPIPVTSIDAGKDCPLIASWFRYYFRAGAKPSALNTIAHKSAVYQLLNE